MAKSKLIFSTRDLEDASKETLRGINQAVLAAAFHIRDEMRDIFRKSDSLYEHSTENYKMLANGIMVGKLKNSQVKIHALGNYVDDGTWKARLFVGGTTYRKTNKGNKGFIKANNAIDKGFSNAETTLNTFIKNILDN